MKRTPLKRPKNVIRQLRPGEEPPTGEPRRYESKRGYVRLRWKVGRYEYVEVYEHRWVKGVPAADVHHEDHDKSHNDPDNLEVLSRSEHARHHGALVAAASRRVNEWQGYRSQHAYDKAKRREATRRERQEFLRQVAELYRSGLSTVEVGKRLGRHASTISIALRAAGVLPRQVAGRNTDISNAVRQLVYARAQMCCERCGRNLAWSGRQVHHRRPRRMGGDRRTETSGAANLVLLCLDCHSAVEARRTDALVTGFLLHDSEIPVRHAVEHYAFGWCYLTDDGEFVHERPVMSA